MDQSNKHIKADTEASFVVDIDDNDRINYSKLTGDFNPLHNSEDYAKEFGFDKPVLHGAFLCGLISRMAGMYLPGENCLLHQIKINFNKPILTPIKILVTATEVFKGFVDVSILNESNNKLLAKANYTYSERIKEESISLINDKAIKNNIDLNTVQINQDIENILVTGSSGELAKNILEISRYNFIKASRHDIESDIKVSRYSEISKNKLPPLKAIIHCAWPSPLEMKLLEDSEPELNISEQLSQPILDVIELAKVLKERGSENSKLILVGSSWSSLGRHKWIVPYYSLSKGLLPTISKILTYEFAESNKSVITVVPDWIPAGMNSNPSRISIASNRSRYPRAKLSSMKELAEFIDWIIQSPSNLISGSSIELNNSALP